MEDPRTDDQGVPYIGVVSNDHEIRSNSGVTPEVLTALEMNEDGDAVLFINLHRGVFVYDHSAGAWYRWAGHYWQEDLIGDAMAAVSSVVEIYAIVAKRQAWARLKAEKAGSKEEAKRHGALEDALMKRIRLLQTVARKNNVLTLARSGADSLGITGEEWDRCRMHLGCQNGVIDLKTGQLLDGRPGDYIKTIAPTIWRGLDAEAPVWNDFLFDIFNGDDELVRYIQRALGYAITGMTVEHNLFILWGIGRNGKGTLLEVLGHVLGNLAGQIEAEMMLEQRRGGRQSGSATSDIMALRGKRIAWGSETSDGRRLNVGKIKWLTGGDTLVGREVFGRRQVSFRPAHKLFLITNSRPHAPAGDYALWSRIHLIPFVLSFVTEPKEDFERLADLGLMDKLKAEASGILAWLVRGCLEWQQHGLKPPEIVKAAVHEYRKDEDEVEQFIDEACVVDPAVSASMMQIYIAYRAWAESNGLGGKVTLRRLSKELVDRGYHRDDSNRRKVVFRGIGVKDQHHDDGDEAARPWYEKEGQNP